MQAFVDALQILGLLRAVEVSEATYRAYVAAAEAQGVPAAALIEACRRLSLRERAEGETAFPSFGQILRLARQVAAEGHRRRLAAVETHHRRLLDAARDRPELSRAEAKAFVDALRAQVEVRRRARRIGGHHGPVA